VSCRPLQFGASCVFAKIIDPRRAPFARCPLEVVEGAPQVVVTGNRDPPVSDQPSSSCSYLHRLWSGNETEPFSFLCKKARVLVSLKPASFTFEKILVFSSRPYTLSKGFFSPSPFLPLLCRAGPGANRYLSSHPWFTCCCFYIRPPPLV